MMKHDAYREQLSALLDGELNDAERAEALAHLDTCEECRRYFAEMTAMHEAFGEMEQIDAPEGFASGVMARLREEAKPQAAKKRRPWRGVTTLAACAAVVVLAVTTAPNLFRKDSASSSGSAAPQAAEPTEALMSTAAAPSGGSDTYGFDREDGAPEAEPYREESAEEPAAADVADDTYDAFDMGSGDAAPETAKAVRAENEYTDLTLSGEGAADYLLANGAEPGEVDGSYFVDASALQSLPEGLTLGGAQADRVEELSGVKVHVRVAETEATP